jgi:hypothetical protein
MTDWVAHRIEQLYGMKVVPKARAPSHMTCRRVLQDAVKPAELEGLLSEFQQGRLEDGEEVVFSKDGKRLRGTIPPRLGLVSCEALLGLLLPIPVLFIP